MNYFSIFGRVLADFLNLITFKMMAFFNKCLYYYIVNSFNFYLGSFVVGTGFVLLSKNRFHIKMCVFGMISAT